MYVNVFFCIRWKEKKTILIDDTNNIYYSLFDLFLVKLIFENSLYLLKRFNSIYTWLVFDQETALYRLKIKQQVKGYDFRKSEPLIMLIGPS